MRQLPPKSYPVFRADGPRKLRASNPENSNSELQGGKSVRLVRSFPPWRSNPQGPIGSASVPVQLRVPARAKDAHDRIAHRFARTYLQALPITERCSAL